MHTFLLLDAVTPTLVASRMQIFLDRFADSHILDLNLMAELHRRFARGTADVSLRQIPLKDRQRTFGIDR